MKRHAFRRTIVALATMLLSTSLFSVPVTDDQAAEAAASLVAAGGAMDARLEGGVSEVRALTPPDGAAPFRVVKFADGGFVVTSGDTEDDPFVFISDGPGDVVEDDENPLWGILRHNMSANEAVRATNATARARGVRAQSVSTAENKWAKWLPGGNGRVRPRAVAVPGTSVSDICVPRIMDIRWNQRGSGIASHYYNDAIPHHCAVGCVAVAVGQIIRHYRWPATIGVVTNTCTVWNGKHGDESKEEDVELTTSGATYDWSAMPAAPDLYANPPGQTDVSRFLRDVGITVKMNWRAPDDDTSEDGGSGATTIREAFYALHDVWGYTNVVWNHHGAVVPDNDPPSADDEAVIQKVKDIYLPCLAAGMPVIASISGHEIVADGYGYSDETLYFHINYGWGGSNSSSAVTKNTGWYVATLPIQGHETGISSSIYNISTNAVGSLFSGRVFGRNGRPIANAEVYAIGADGVGHTATANAAGVYVFNLPPGSYNVYAAIDGEMDIKEVVTQQNKSAGLQPGIGTNGNVSGVDLYIGADTSFVWTGGGDGRSFGDARNWSRKIAPPNGSTVVFHPMSGDLTLNNDIADFGPANILFLPSQYGCTITNKSMSGVSSIVNASSATNVFKVAVSFAGDIDVMGAVAFADGGSATGVKPVNHSEYLGIYNLTTPAWTPDARAAIASNSIVNVASMQISEEGVLEVRAGGTLNVSGDVVMSSQSDTRVSIVHANDGEINILGRIQVDGKSRGYPCTQGNGTIRVRGIVNNSLLDGFSLYPYSGDCAVSWEIGEEGLAVGTNGLPATTDYSFYFGSAPEQPTINLKALANFSIDGRVQINRPVVLDADGHTVTINARLRAGEGSLTLTGGGVVRSTANVVHQVNNPINLDDYVMPATVVVEPGTTLVLDSGAYPTKGTCTICPGAALVLPQIDPSYSVKLGTLQMAGGAMLVVSNFTGDVASLDVKSFVRTGEGAAPISLRVTAPTPVLRHGLLATGVNSGDLSWFSLDECNVGGSEATLELVNGTLFAGSPALSYAWNGTQSDWHDAGAWTLDGSAAGWSRFNNAVFATPGSTVSLSSDATVSRVCFLADATIGGEGFLSVLQVYVAQGVVGTIAVPFSAGVEKVGPGTLVFTQDRKKQTTILSEGTLKAAVVDGTAARYTLERLSFGSDHSKEVAIDYNGKRMDSPKLDALLQDGIRITLTNGVFGAGYDELVFSEAHLPAVLTIAKDAVVSNRQHKISLADGSTRVINIAGGKMYSTKDNNHWLMQASPRGRLDINVTDGGLLEFWNELYALTCRDGEGYVDPSLHITMKDSTFRIRNNKSFRFGWDGKNKNAVSPVGVFAATNSVFEAYGFFLGNDVVGSNTAGSYTADFEGCTVSVRQFRVFHDRPLNAVRFNNTRLVLTANDDRWLTATNAFNSVWHVNPITVGEGGLVMDSNGNKGSLVANLQGPGTVTKAGRGTLTVSCNQTGTGPFVCQAGTTLFESGLTVTRPITLQHAATLKIDGTTKVSLGDLSLVSGSTLSIKGSTESAAPISVTALTLPEDSSVELRNNDGWFEVGTYAILEMPGITAAQVSGKLKPSIIKEYNYAYTVKNGTLMLTVKPLGYTLVAAVAPTCEQPGNIAYLEGSNGHYYDVDTHEPLSQADIRLDPLGHDWTGWTVVTPASDAAAGEATRDCTRCGAHETQTLPMLQHSKFSLRNSGNTFYITRSSGATAETVYYRTVGISAYTGQNFVNQSGRLTFAPGVTNMSVTVTEQTPSQAAFKYQTGTTRAYRLELTDAGGFPLVSTPPVRNMTTGSQFSTAYLNRAVTNLVYFSNAGALQSGAGNKYLDVTYGPSSYRQVTDGGYKQGVHTISTGNLFGNSNDLRSYLHNLNYKMYATIYFTQKEEQDGYQYIQILADNSTTYDGDDGDGTVSNPQTSLYKACFILSYSDSGSVMSDDHYQFFPHRYDYKDKATETAAGISQYEFDYGNSHLYRQAFKSTSYRAPTSGSLSLPVTNKSLSVRFDAAGSGGDTWDFKNMKARLALVDANVPVMIGATVSDGPYHRGNLVTVSLSFSEIVVPTSSGGFYLNTTWGLLGYDSSSSGGNVLTFSGKIAAASTNGLPLSVNGFTGLTSIKDLAGNEVAAANLPSPRLVAATISESVDYAISYDLAGGTLPPDEDPNPTTYNYDSDIIFLTNPVRPGYTFAGWSGTDLNGIVSDVIIRRNRSGDRAYTAHWTPIVYPISYPNAMNGVANVVNSNPVSYTVEDDTITLSAPTRTGYMFGGWFADAACTIPAQTTFSASDMQPKTFYAAWYNPDWADDGRSGDSEEDAYLVYTQLQLDILASRVNSGYSYSGKFFRLMADIAYDPSVPNNFTPIGEAYVSTANIVVAPGSEYRFNGTFDGNGHVLSGIRLGQAEGGAPEDKVVAPFCLCGNTATIKNLIVANAEIEGDCAGGIVGKCEGTVSNCYVVGTTVTVEQGGIVAGDVSDSASLVGNAYHDCVLVVHGESRVADIGTAEGDIPGGAEECYAITAAPGVAFASAPDVAVPLPGVTNRCWKTGSPVRLEYADHLSAGQIAVFSVNGEQIAGNVFAMPATNTTVSAIVTEGPDWNAPAYAWADDYSCVMGTVSSSDGDYFHESVFVATSVVSRAATCTEAGETTWIAAVPQGNAFGFATQTAVQGGAPAALGHHWVKKSWSWAADRSAASVLLECDRCGVQTNVPAVLTLDGQTWDAFTWRATVEIDGQTFSDFEFQLREKYAVKAGDGVGGRFKVCYVKSNAWENVLVDFAITDYNVSPANRGKSPAGESIYIVPDGRDLVIVSASVSGEPLQLLWDSALNYWYFIMPAHDVTVSVVFNSDYPRYLDGADDYVWDCYDEWAAEYGNDEAGTNEVAFLLNVAPGAVTNGVTPLKIVELGVTNRLVSESGDYGLFAQEMLGYSGDDYLTYRRIVLASDVTELTQRSAFGYQGDICNGYLVLHIGIDLSEPRENWLAFSWPCEVVDGQVVLEFPELLLEKYRESVARDTGKPCNSLFFSASISTKEGDPPYELMAAIYQAMDQGGYEESEP